MPVDPQIQGMLELLARMNSPQLSSLTPQAARDGFELMTVGMRSPEMLTPVANTRDLTISVPSGAMKARIYHPVAASEEGLATVLFAHGGGFVVGSVETHDNAARTICRDTGAVVLSVDYPLAPEAKWPVAVEDVFAALRWAGEHIAELGGDGRRLAVAGDSAGGNLAAVVAQLARDAGLELCGQLLIYPVVDFDPDEPYPSRVDNAEGFFLTADDMLWFASLYLPEGADTCDPTLSPLRAKDLTGLAPAVVLTAEYDPLRDEGDAYAAALQAAGVPVRHHRFDGLIHGFFDLGLLSAAAAKAVEVGCAEFAELLSAPAASTAA